MFATGSLAQRIERAEAALIADGAAAASRRLSPEDVVAVPLAGGVAVMTTEPGSKSQQNAQRFGFSVLYVRAVLVKSERPA